VPTGENPVLSANFDKDGEDPPCVSTGIMSLYHGDVKVGEGRIKTQPGKFAIAGEVCASDETAANPSQTTTLAPRPEPLWRSISAAAGPGGTGLAAAFG
jgi:hypothetical protein